MRTLILILSALLSTALLPISPYDAVEVNLLPGLSSVRNDDAVISDYDKYKTALDILRTAIDRPSVHADDNTLNSTTISDLALLFYDVSKPDFTILNRIKRTQTTLGTAELARILVSPLHNSEKLTERQEIIRLLVSNNTLRRSLKSIIAAFAKHEDQLIALWNPEDRLYSKNMNQAFYAGNMHTSINNKFFLELRNRYNDFIPTITFIAAFFVFHFGEKMAEPPTTWWQKEVRPRIKYVPLLGSVISISNYLNNLHNRRSLIGLARQRLSSLVALKNAIEKIEIWGRRSANETHSIPALKTISSFGGQSNDDIHDFFKTLRSPSFDVKSKYLSSFVGPVLSAVPTFADLKPRLCPALHAIAQLDAYLSIADLYIDHQDAAQIYSFASYQGKEHGPAFTATQFWHPVLSPNKAIASSLIMGGASQERNVVLTGPNAAGKSTISKAIMLNALLAQTLTISPARQLSITPFHVLNTYLNIVDNIGSGISQHRAEVRRALTLIENITQLPSDQYALTIMDEMFRCTDPSTGAAAAFGIGATLGTYPNSLLILATHFATLTHLPEHAEGNYSNYRVSAVKNDDGSFTFPYRLEPGINQKVIALDLLAHEGFDAQILDYAYQHLARIQEHTSQEGIQTFVTNLRERISQTLSN